MSPITGIYAPESYQMDTGFSAISLFRQGKYIITGDYSGMLRIYRNPLLVSKYNNAVEKGDKVMEAGKYSLVLSVYKMAMYLYPEKEIEEKMEEAQKGKEKMAAKRFRKIRKTRGQWKR